MVLSPIVHCLQYILLLLFCSSVLLLLFSCSVISDCDAMIRSSPGSLLFTISWSWLRLMSIQSVMPSNHLILFCLLFFFPSIFPNIRVFTNESALPINIQKFRASTSASDIPMNIQRSFPSEMTGLISFLSRGLSRVFSSTTIQQHQFVSAQPSLQSSAHSHPHMIPGKIIALTSHTSFTNVMSLLCIM